MAIDSDAIESAATGPASASGEMGSHTARSVDELLKARNDIAQETANAEAHLGLRFVKLKPGGSV